MMVAVALTFGTACKGDKSAAAVPTSESTATAKPGSAVVAVEGAVAKRGSIWRPERAFLGVIAPPGADTSKLQALAEATAEREGLTVTSQLDAKRATITLKLKTPTDVGWVREHAQYYGDVVPPADHDRIGRSTWALWIGGQMPDQRTLVAARVGAVAIAVAKACNGWILDTDKHQLFTPAALAEHLPSAGGVDVRKTIVVHEVSGGAELTFLDTAGMNRFGFPELYVAFVPRTRVNSVTNLLNATAQTLIERGDLIRDGEIDVDLSKLTGDWELAELVKFGGTGRITWQARWGRGDAEPDEKLEPDELVLELSVKGAQPGTAEALVAAAKVFFGAEPDEVIYPDYADELDAAAAVARGKLAALRPHFAGGVPLKEQLAIKAAFASDDGAVEFMWVDAIAFEGEMIDGTLDNDPKRVLTLRLGQRVKVKFADVADFIHTRADGTKVGGYSLETMRAHGEDVPPLRG